jgi:thioredoxin-related protein
VLDERKLVFVDFTGKTCTNCKLNEKNVFSKAAVRQWLQKYVLVQLYTDVVPDWYYSSEEQVQFGNSTARQQEDARKNSQFELDAFGTKQLPLYVVLEPQPGGTFKVLRKYAEGKISSQTAFVRFLQQPLNGRRSPAPVLANTAPLPGQPAVQKPTVRESAGLNWGSSLAKGLAEAREKKGLVFLDFSGVGCLPCRANEKDFTRPELQDLLRRYSLVQLYTDEVPKHVYPADDLAATSLEKRKADAKANSDFQWEHFKVNGPPFYVILRPKDDGKFEEVRRFDGRITDLDGFTRFLREPLEAHASLQRAEVSTKNGN